jgi:hypothetical protein
MFTRSALVLALLAMVELGIIALAAPPAPVLLWSAVVAVSALGVELVLRLRNAADARRFEPGAPLSSLAPARTSDRVDHIGWVGGLVDHRARVGGSADPARGIGSVAWRVLTVPPTKMAAPPGLR